MRIIKQLLCLRQNVCPSLNLIDKYPHLTLCDIMFLCSFPLLAINQRHSLTFNRQPMAEAKLSLHLSQVYSLHCDLFSLLLWSCCNWTCCRFLKAFQLFIHEGSSALTGWWGNPGFNLFEVVWKQGLSDSYCTVVAKNHRRIIAQHLS